MQEQTQSQTSQSPDLATEIKKVATDLQTLATDAEVLIPKDKTPEP